MKKFEILRYVKHYYLLILVLAIAGAFMIYNYGKSNQSYTATAVIRYTNSGASSGLAPNGEEIKVEEVYSSTVIDDAMNALGLHGTLDSIRSRFNVVEIIPEDQQRINDALRSKGETPDYHPTEYKVTFVANGTHSADYARDVMDAVLQSYMSFYSEKYVEQTVRENGIPDPEESSYDYLETAEILEKVTKEMITYLQERMETFPDNRSSQTGFTFEDLYELYDHLYNYEIPRIYAAILADSETMDRALMLDKLNNNRSQCELRIAKLATQIEKLKALIDRFSKSNESMLRYHYSSGDTNGDGVDDIVGTDYILKNVEDNRGGGNVQTTYDALLQEYTGLRLEYELAQIENKHIDYLLETFRALDGDSGDNGEVDTLIRRYVGYMDRYYELVSVTGAEMNAYLSARYLKMVSTIKVTTAINVKLYVILALAFFTIVGFFGAIVLGRLIDIVDYLLYVDKRVDMPNRACCDRRIDELAEQLLPDNFAFVSIRFTVLRSLSERFGRPTSDKVLHDFAAILKSFSENYGFIGYNGNGQFMAFFSECNRVKCDLIMKAFEKSVKEYNGKNPGREIEYEWTCANTTADEDYEIRSLMRRAFGRSGNKEQEGK